MTKILAITFLALFVLASTAEARGASHAYGAHRGASTAHHSLNYSIRHMFGGK